MPHPTPVLEGISCTWGWGSYWGIGIPFGTLQGHPRRPTASRHPPVGVLYDTVGLLAYMALVREGVLERRRRNRSFPALALCSPPPPVWPYFCPPPLCEGLQRWGPTRRWPIVSELAPGGCGWGLPHRACVVPRSTCAAVAVCRQ